MATQKFDSLEQQTDEALSNAEKNEIRMVLVGKTGAAKSNARNTILGRTVFKYDMSAASVTSVCEKETGEFEGQLLSVVDTPGLFDTRMSEEEVKMEIAKCIWYAAPGPHVFLIVIQAGRFTEEEQKIVKLIQDVFGEKAADYTMVVSTHRDDLEKEEVSIEESINANPALRAFISQCGGRYVVLNNISQVRELLEKIGHLANGGERYYKNEMLQKARGAILDAMVPLQRENEGMNVAEARQQAEGDNKFVQAFVGTGVPLGSLGPGGAAVGEVLQKAAGEIYETFCSIQ